MGLIISKGTRAMGPKRIKPTPNHPLPMFDFKTSERILRHHRLLLHLDSGLWGTSQPLYKLITEIQQAKTDKLVWSPDAQKAFKALQTALLQVPTLSLPTGSEFNLFVTERKGMALGVMTQLRRPHYQPRADLSKGLDVVAWGWPHFLRVIADTALLVPEALKSTNRQNITLLTSHDVSGILNSKVNIWMTESAS